MDITIISEANFSQAETGIWLVKFWSAWCGPCVKMEYLKEVSNANIGSVNVEENQNLADKYAITFLPTYIAFKDGKILYKIAGLQSPQMLNKMMQSVSNEAFS